MRSGRLTIRADGRGTYRNDHRALRRYCITASDRSLQQCKYLVVPLAGLEPACLSAFDFESNASTNFATGAAKDAHG